MDKKRLELALAFELRKLVDPAWMVSVSVMYGLLYDEWFVYTRIKHDREAYSDQDFMDNNPPSWDSAIRSHSAEIYMRLARKVVHRTNREE